MTRPRFHVSETDLVTALRQACAACRSDRSTRRWRGECAACAGTHWTTDPVYAVVVAGKLAFIAMLHEGADEASNEIARFVARFCRGECAMDPVEIPTLPLEIMARWTVADAARSYALDSPKGLVDATLSSGIWASRHPRGQDVTPRQRRALERLGEIVDELIATDSGSEAHDSGIRLNAVQLEIARRVAAAGGGWEARDNRDPAPVAPDLEHLSDEALVAILVGAQAAKRLLAVAGSLQALARWSLPEIINRGRVPEKRAQALLAGLTAGRRGSGTRLARGASVQSAAEAYAVLKPLMEHLTREKFMVLLLDSKAHLISARLVSTGSLTATMVHPRDVFAPAVTEHAYSIILAHNHPSGQPGPSEQDIALTRRLVATGDLLGIAVNDHLIVGDQDFYSFAEAGALRQ